MNTGLMMNTQQTKYFMFWDNNANILKVKTLPTSRYK